MGGFRKGSFSNNRSVLKPDVAIASEVLILSKNSLAIADFHVKKTQHVQLPSDTKFLLTKNYSEIIIFEQFTNLTRNSLKMSFFPGHFESANRLKNNEK